MSNASTTTGVLLCGHGSRDAEAQTEFERFTLAVRSSLAARRPQAIVQGAFLEFSTPSLVEGLEKLIGRGVDRIVVQPLMLFAARHSRSDIPNAVKAFAKAHPEIEVTCGEELPPDDALLSAAIERIQAAESALSDSFLLVIGRGSSDPDANKVLATLTKDLCHRLKMDKGEFAFAGIAEPNIEQGLANAIARQPRRIVVFPYFLFTGVLVKRVHQLTGNAASKNPQIGFTLAHHLADHSALVGAVTDRIAEMADGLG
jgi:sirohydrochlorin cobaltochelatase